MALTNIEYGSVASSKLLNDNFNYLEDKIEGYSKNIANDKASLIALINSQISTTFTQLTNNIEALYPVGAIYIGTTDECPVANLFGTWEKVAEGLCLQGAKGSQVPGEIVEAGLPDHIHNLTKGTTTQGYGNWSFATSGTHGNVNNAPTNKASVSNPIYGKSDTVQPPAYLVNIWRRVA